MTTPAQRLVVVGAAGFGRETLDVLDARMKDGISDYQLVGVIDDAPSDENLQRLRRRHADYLGHVDGWLSRGDDARYVVAIGNPQIRRAIAAQFDARGIRAATLIHPSVNLGFGTQFGPGVVVCAGAQVSTEVRLGAHCHINPSATVGHDTVLRDFVSVNPGAIVSGGCTVEEGALLGAGSVVLQGLTVGTGAIVGAAACVTRDVDAYSVVKGVPAR